MTLDSAVVTNSYIESSGTGVAVQLSNVLIYNSAGRPLELGTGTSGTIRSSTLVTHAVGGTAPQVAKCPSTVLIRSSILWGVDDATAVAAGCGLQDVIAGPNVVPSAMNVDPMFVDASSDDYHLASGSPARDAVDTGPALDFERTPRPQGARYDIGADEALP